MIPVWITLPYLPVYLVRCKSALFSIASTIGKPLRVDQATASLNRPTVARVLVECDVSQPSFTKKVWVGDGNYGFVQDIIIEQLPAYCMSCKHLGHSQEKCYIANPSLRPSFHWVKEKGKGLSGVGLSSVGGDVCEANPAGPINVPLGSSIPIDVEPLIVPTVSVSPNSLARSECTVAQASTLIAPMPDIVHSVDPVSPIIVPPVVGPIGLSREVVDVAVNLQSKDIPNNQAIDFWASWLFLFSRCCFL